jgi:hypothetical protein
LTGLVVILIGDMGLNNIKLEAIARSENSWEVTGYLFNDKTYVLRIESGDEWDKMFTKGKFDVPQPVNVTIVSPSGNLTKLQAFFFGVPSTSPYVPQAPTTVVEVEYFFIDSNSLKVEEESTLIRFTVKKEGTYTARVIEEELNWARGPPLEMIFFKEFVENGDFYMFIRLFGFVIGMVGFSISIWGAATTKKVMTKKRKTSKK